MPSQLIASNVVIAARQFNPSIFSQLWLVRNKIVGENDFGDHCLFSDEVAKIETRHFRLLVVPPQLQFLPRESDTPENQLIEEKVGAIVATLPHTPYTGIGLNYCWHVWPDNGQIGGLSRALFCSRDSLVFQAFDTDDAMFGAYFSKNILDCRLKLDVKPITVRSENEETQRLQFAFNFHLDLPEEDAVSQVQRHLQRWAYAKEEARRIVDMSAE